MSSHRRLAIIGFAVAVAYAAITLVFVKPFLLSAMLFADDALILPRAAAEVPISSSRWEVTLVNVATSLGSVTTAKALGIATTAIAAGILAAFLASVSRRPALSGMAALAVALYPISLAPGIFAIGSHPYFAAPWAVLAVAVLWAGWVCQARRSVLAVAGSGFLASIAAGFSPAAMLFAVAPFLFVVFWSFFSWPGRSKFWAALAASLLPAIVVPALNLTGYHYTGIVGWVEVSPATMVDSVRASVSTVIVPVADSGLWAKVAFLIAIVSFVGSVAIAVMTGRRSKVQASVHRRPRQEQAGAVFLLVLSAALTFGPGSIVTSYHPRYLVLPFIFIFSAALLCVLLVAPLRATPATAVVSVGMLLLVTGSAVSAVTLRTSEFQPYLRTHGQIQKIIADEADQWDDDAQVVVVLPPGEAVATFGFNHWSTWYLRSISGRADITGLIGQRDWLAGDPFVQNYTDHGSEYWAVVAGRSMRVKMKGITRHRPLYLYDVAADGTYDRRPVAFAGSEKINLVPPGGSPAKNYDGCTGAAPLIWPVEAEMESVSGGDRQDLSTTWHLDGRNTRKIELRVNQGEPVRLKIALEAPAVLGTDVFSETTPSMPFLSEHIAAYERRDGVALFDRDSRQSWLFPREDARVEIWLEGVEGCFMLVRGSDGVVRGSLARASVSGEWAIGGGFLERSWPGRITLSGVQTSER